MEEKSNQYNEAGQKTTQERRKEFNTTMLVKKPEDIGKNNSFNILICFDTMAKKFM